MLKNFFFLSRFAGELSSKLRDCRFREAFSQESGKLVIALRTPDETDIYLEINTNTREAIISLRDSYGKAKKNVALFFQELNDALFISCTIGEFDRILKFAYDKGQIFFLLRGAQTNVFALLPGGIKTAFLKVKPENEQFLWEEIELTNYLPFAAVFDRLMENIEQYDDIEQLRSQPFLGKDIKMILEPFSNSVGDYKLRLADFVKALLNDPLVLSHSHSSTKMTLLPGSYTPANNITIFESDNCQAIIKKAIIEEIRLRKFTERYVPMMQYFEKEVFFLEQKLGHLERLHLNAVEEQTYRKMAELLLEYAETIDLKKGVVELTSAGSPEIYRIKLDPKLTVFQNADRYFRKAYGKRKEAESAMVEIPKIRERLQQKKSLKTKLHLITDMASLEIFIENNALSQKASSRNKTAEHTRFREYVIDAKYSLYIGKSAVNNDELTTQFAKPQDYWFHARGYSGSHAVLQIDGKTAQIPKPVLETAAAAVAFFSKGKNAKIVPVAYTQKKYVVKRKGMPIGQVMLLKEHILHVRPELRKNCIPVKIDH